MTLELVDVRAAPGGAPVLHGVDLTVEPDECMAVLGPSGAGKTTLLRVIAGLEPATDGSVTLSGRALDVLPPERRNLAVVFQEARLFPSMDVGDNVAFPLRMSGSGRGERRARAAELLSEVGLADFGERHTRSLSGGEAQRVALARALVTDPAALLLDEPFAAVDPARRDDLRQLVDRIRRERHLPTLLVTHDRDDAALLGDRIAVLLEGRIAQVGPARHVFDRPATVAVARFVGCDSFLDVDGTRLATRPELVVLGQGPHRGEVRQVIVAADHARVRLAVGGQTIEARVSIEAAPPPGDVVDFDLPHATKLLDDGPPQ